MQSLMGCSWFGLGVNSRILVFCCRAGVGRWSAERRRSARGIWLEAAHAINAHRSDRSGGNVARPSRQPSRSNAVVRGHYQGRFLFLQLQSANLRNVRAGGDRRQPRILQSEPVLPQARIRSAQGQAEAILLLIHGPFRHVESSKIGRHIPPGGAAIAWPTICVNVTAGVAALPCIMVGIMLTEPRYFRYSIRSSRYAASGPYPA
jgi:hypothetical protein